MLKQLKDRWLRFWEVFFSELYRQQELPLDWDTNQVNLFLSHFDYEDSEDREEPEQAND